MKSAERLIADLDSSQFALREAAGRKLAELGEQAKPELRRALAGNPSAEVPGIFPGANYPEGIAFADSTLVGPQCLRNLPIWQARPRLVDYTIRCRCRRS